MNKNRRQPFAALILCALANTANSQADDLTALLAILEEETALATQSKMNADYVPGMVTILHRENLQTLGYSDVAAALNQVAGFHTTVNNAGDVRTLVRGVGATLNSSNLKLMVNGVAVNRATDGSADWVLRLPLAQIDRIEVIRGPGSALYGEFAFSGTVNIITRSDNSVGAEIGSNDSTQMNASFAHQWDNSVSLNGTVAYWDSGNSGLYTNPDNFAGFDAGFSPGKVYDHEQGATVLAQLGLLGWQGNIYLADVERGPGYGESAAMPREFEPRKEQIWQLDLIKSWTLSETLTFATQLTHLQTDLDHATYLPIPEGVRGPGGRPIRESRFTQEGNSDRETNLTFSAHWHLGEGHRIYLDTGYTHSEVTDSFRHQFVIGGPIIEVPQDELALSPGTRREYIHFTAQDQWQINQAIELTLGVRYDDYSDWGSNLAPRIAAVWRASDNHIVKMQYAEAFRPPSLAESGDVRPGRPTGRPDGPPGRPTQEPPPPALTEERLNSSEIAYIYKRPSFKFSGTVFHTTVEDLIEFHLQPGQRPYWRNRGDIDSYGLELEWQQKLGRSWEWNANVSYVDAEDHFDVDKTLLGSIAWLANADLVWHASQHFDHALKIRYVGSQEGWELDLRTPVTERFQDYTSLDYTLSVNKLLQVNGLTLRASVLNIFSDRHNSVPTPAQYPQGLPQGERTVNAQLEYRF
ncbi:TonB-dependent siderophore receptor [Gilvimarinus sp. DA14]|uniref:TonB-dependent receptor plug domain-containing protein n=1 Tax=Gilvimarinus sp. DA14 TaxID=2956798 RepID=UPI0020B68FCD|nr:TonB-dependent receptor [Gilvimarinus sp. DA14]UTF61771.1 TonB-dependent receptor [Gilvimarinus sp. DA14]